MMGWSRLLQFSATFAAWLALESWAPPAVAQSQPALVSAVAQVQLSVTVPPRVVLPAAIQPAAVAWQPGTTNGVASISFSANAPYQLLARRTESETSAARRIWIENESGRLVEVVGAGPVVIRRGRASSGLISVPFRLTADSGMDGRSESLPVRFDVVVEPTQ